MNPRFRDRWGVSVRLALCLLFATTPATETLAGEGKVDFGRHIRPILADKCFACHGPDEETRKGDLRLDTEEDLFAELDEGFAVVPGEPEKSVVYQVLVTANKRKRMPPRRSKKELSDAEIELIRRWITDGADWKSHWSLVAPKRPAIPEVLDADWPRNDIDFFVLGPLERESLVPSPEADRTTLIRRLTFDLTGLPPTPDEIDAFLGDNSSAAYERVVDRLLRSPHYGEHMARYWLDAARYGDTHGMHFDNERRMWPYRNWVIDAFNANKPFDVFTIEQLAGDLLPDATIDQKIATGFNRCNVTTNEGGVIEEEYHVHYTVDRVATMSTVWMGISMGCVRCHEHKFDPFEMRDFYQLYAFFNNLDGPVMDGNKPLPPPFLKVPNAANQEQIDALEPDLASLTNRLEAHSAAAGADCLAWESSIRRSLSGEPALPTDGLVGHWPFDESEGDLVRSTVHSTPGRLRGAQFVGGKLGDALEVGEEAFVDLGDVCDFDRTDAFSYGGWVKFESESKGGAVLARMDDTNAYRGYDIYILDQRVIAHFVHAWPSNALKVQTKSEVKPDEWQHILVTYDGSGKSAGVRIYLDGEASPLKVLKDTLTETIRSGASLQVGRRTPSSSWTGLVDDVRFYDRALSASEARDLVGVSEIRAILDTRPEDRTVAQQGELRTYYLSRHDARYRKLSAELAELETEKLRLENDDPIETLVWKERAEVRPAHILVRGEYDKSGERVHRDTPAALPPLPQNPDGGVPTRLDLARWLVTEEHPLSSRVTVNRFWQQYFGVGLVKTSEDFGSQGEQPSHPKLLDWLAVEFRESGWDVKRLQKLIVMSATYRQSSAATPASFAKDPENRLLARGPRFRLEAEVVRDNALAVSGLLVRNVGGPSVRPYQPPGIWKAVGYTSSNTANYTRDSGEALYRRSMYTFWKRTAPPPAMVAFDAPSRENCAVRRSRTNTPMAALTLMNDEQFIEASRCLAERMLTEGGATDEDRLAYAFRLATGRIPRLDELEVLRDVYHTNLSKYEEDREAAMRLIHVGESEPLGAVDESRLAAWTMVANLILNLDETITKG